MIIICLLKVEICAAHEASLYFFHSNGIIFKIFNSLCSSLIYYIQLQISLPPLLSPSLHLPYKLL